jgi:prophage regulatory protein
MSSSTLSSSSNQFKSDLKFQQRGGSMSQVFPMSGFVRLSAILAPVGPLPIARATLWAWVKDGRFPKPLKLGARVTVWRAEDVHAFMASVATAGRLS